MSGQADAVTLRPATPADEPAFIALYAALRAEAFRALPLPPEQRAALVAQQYAARRRQYTAYPGLEDRVVLAGDRGVGRLILSRTAQEVRVVDIALAPERWGRGIGTRLLRSVIDDADRRATPVTLQVEADNPALRLYRRLGFTPAPEQPGGAVRIALIRPAGP